MMQAARLALRPFEHDHRVLQLDGHRDVAARDAVHAVGELLGRDDRRRRAGRGCRAAAAAGVRRRRHQLREVLGVLPCRGDRGHEGFHADLFLGNPGRDLQPAEIPVVLVEQLDMQVAEHRVLDPGFHAVDRVLGADVAYDICGCPTGAFCRAPRNNPAGSRRPSSCAASRWCWRGARRNPHGVTQICSCCAHAAFAGVIIWS